MECLNVARDAMRRMMQRAMLAAMAVTMSAPVAAQVQRSIINPSFEAPNLTTIGCRVYINESQVPGWTTNHAPYQTENSGGCIVNGSAGTTNLGASPGPILELWKTPRDNASGGIVNAPDGSQIAELNAQYASRIYQNVCLINGESFNWTFSHRGRGSATSYDTANFVVGASTLIAQVGTTNNGAYQAPIPATVTAANVSGNATWVKYSGSYTYSGATGVNSLGFEATNGSTSGNLLDNIQIQLAPFVEFVQASSSGLEAAGDNLPQIRVNGTVFSAMTVTVLITGGTATRGATGATNVDYTTTGGSATLTINVPAGIYDGTAATNSLFTVPVTIVNNSTPQSNRTINFQLQASTASPKAYLLNSSTSCGAAAQATSTYTIIDDDSVLTLSKNVTSYAAGATPDQFTIVYTITVTNPWTGSGNGAVSYGLTDAPGFDPDVTITGASYTFDGGGATALAGTGPWTLATNRSITKANTPDTYVVTVTGTIARPGSTANDACTGAGGSGLYNLATLTQSTSTFTANACRPTQTPGWLTLSKQLVGRTASGDQAQLRLYAGGILSNTASTSGTGTTASIGPQVFASGTAIELRETILQGGTTATAPSNGYATSISCTNGGPTSALPSGSGTTTGTEQAWNGIALAAGDDINCTITNTPKADLSITKSNGDTKVVAGVQTAVYTITVSNGGPATAVNAVVKDAPDPAHLANCQVTTPCSVVNGTASCPAPANLTMANLTGSGVQVPSMAAGSSIQFKVSCDVQ